MVSVGRCSGCDNGLILASSASRLLLDSVQFLVPFSEEVEEVGGGEHGWGVVTRGWW